MFLAKRKDFGWLGINFIEEVYVVSAWHDRKVISETETVKKKLISWLQACDARVKIGLSIITGISVWQARPEVLAVLALAAALLTWIVAGSSLITRRQIGALVLFIGAWTGVKAAMEFIAKNPDGLKQSLILGGRLSVLVLVGLGLAALTSRIQVGRAVTSLLRPVLGNRSWQGAMSLALMIHCIPLTMRTLHTVMQTIALRGYGLSLRKRLYFFVTTVMRCLSRTTMDQTVALAVRGLENERAWQDPQPIKSKEWVLGGVLGGLILGLTIGL